VLFLLLHPSIALPVGRLLYRTALVSLPESTSRPAASFLTILEEVPHLKCAVLCGAIAKAEPVLCAGTQSLDTNWLHELCFAAYGG
jgi:hypothetical protein